METIATEELEYLFLASARRLCILGQRAATVSTNGIVVAAETRLRQTPEGTLIAAGKKHVLNFFSDFGFIQLHVDITLENAVEDVFLGVDQRLFHGLPEINEYIDSDSSGGNIINLISSALDVVETGVSETNGRVQALRNSAISIRAEN